MGQGDASGGGAPKWLQPLMFSILIPGVMGVITVTAMATRYGERIDQLERAAEVRWSALASQLNADDVGLRDLRLLVERQDQRLDGMEETSKNRMVATDVRAQDYGRQLQEMRTDISRLQIILAGLESMLGYSNQGPQQRRHR